MGLVLVDGNNIGFAAQNGPSLIYDGQQVQAIYQALRMIKTIRAESRNHSLPMILWDSRAQWRLDILPEYKGKRDENPDIVAMKEEFKRQKPMLMAMLNALGMHNVTVEGYEADDLAGVFTRGAIARGLSVKLMSGDKDWLQLVQQGVTWNDVIRVRSCTIDDFEEFTSVKTGRQWLEVKALMGDKSDCIPGIPGIGDKTATRLVAHYGCVANFLGHCVDAGGMIAKENLPPDMSRQFKKLDAFARSPDLHLLFERNIELMNLIDMKAPANKALSAGVQKGNFDMKKFREMCEELAFHSIIEELDEWQDLFYVEK